jgi:heptosyltransferase-2
MEIVVRSPNWIGDCVMAVPAIRSLKYWFPESTLYLAAKRRLLDVYRNITEIDTLLPLEDRGGIRTLIADAGKLKAFHFDVGILLTNSFRSALLFKLARVKKRVGYRNEGRGVLLDEGIPFPVNSRHHRFFYLDLIEHYVRSRLPGSRFDSSVFSDGLPVGEQEKIRMENRLKSEGIDPRKMMIGISPSAAYGTAKEWLPERFRELIGKLLQGFSDCQILLFGSESERFRVSEIGEKFRQKVYNFAGRFSLRESMVAMSFCRLFISNDSGLMHVASGLKVPVIGIFGPTVPGKTAPLSRESRILFHRVDCSPCRHRICPVDHVCMKAVPVDEVYATANEFLKDRFSGNPINDTPEAGGMR